MITFLQAILHKARLTILCVIALIQRTGDIENLLADMMYIICGFCISELIIRFLAVTSADDKTGIFQCSQMM